MKANTIMRLENYNFQKLLSSKGYSFYENGNYNLNIIGIRHDGTKLSDEFDDYIVVIYKNSNDVWTRKIFQVTTHPGITIMKHPIASKGAAILVPGQYKGCWELGLHKGQYLALCQRKPVTVYRDGNKDDKFDFEPKTIDKGLFGINIHRAGEDSVIVNNWSAGCQVFKRKKDFNEFIRLCKLQVENKRGTKFTYTLLNENEL
jgi:hypothetical protein